jgi:hypothetical protein
MKLGGCLPTVRAATGMETARDQREALVWNVGTCALMLRETSKWWTHEEPSTNARRRGGRVRTSDEAW